MLSLKFFIYSKYHSAHSVHRDQRMRQVVTYRRLKAMKNHYTFRPKNVVAVTYRRFSFTRGSSCKALSGKVLVFWIGGRLWEVVAYKRWSQMEVRMYLEIYHIWYYRLCFFKIFLRDIVPRPIQRVEPSPGSLADSPFMWESASDPREGNFLNRACYHSLSLLWMKCKKKNRASTAGLAHGFDSSIQTNTQGLKITRKKKEYLCRACKQLDKKVVPSPAGDITIVSSISTFVPLK